MKIVRIGFANFRSFGSAPVIVDLRKRINLLIGANNSGKSNVLEMLRRLKGQQLQTINLSEVDLHRRDSQRKLELILEVEDAANELPGGRGRFHFSLSGRAVCPIHANIVKPELGKQAY